MAGVDFDWNDSFFEAVLKSSGVRSAVETAADNAVSQAKASAPVKTGNYRANIRKEVRTGQKRVYAYVYSDVDYSIPVEMRHGTMAKAASAARI